MLPQLCLSRSRERVPPSKGNTGDDEEGTYWMLGNELSPHLHYTW